MNDALFPIADAILGGDTADVYFIRACEVLEREGIDHRRDHAHRVGGLPVHAAAFKSRTPKEVASAENDAELDAVIDDALRRSGYRVQFADVEAPAGVSPQDLAAQFE